MGKRSPSLRVINIPEPCGEDWNAMDGDSVRSCEHCASNVYNLSEMPAEDAAALMSEGKHCVRVHYDHTGAIVSVPELPSSRLTTEALTTEALTTEALTTEPTDAAFQMLPAPQRAPRAAIAGLALALATPVAVSGLSVDDSMTQGMKEGEVKVALGLMRIRPKVRRTPEQVKRMRERRERRREYYRQYEENAPERYASAYGSVNVGDTYLAHTRLDASEPLIARGEVKGGLSLMGTLATVLFAMLATFLPLRTRREERWRTLDAWSIPQLSALAGGLWVGAAANLPMLLVGGALLGSGLALSRMARRLRGPQDELAEEPTG